MITILVYILCKLMCWDIHQNSGGSARGWRLIVISPRVRHHTQREKTIPHRYRIRRVVADLYLRVRHFGLNPCAGRVIDPESLYLDTSLVQWNVFFPTIAAAHSHGQKEIDDINSPAAARVVFFFENIIYKKSRRSIEYEEKKAAAASSSSSFF